MTIEKKSGTKRKVENTINVLQDMGTHKIHYGGYARDDSSIDCPEYGKDDIFLAYTFKKVLNMENRMPKDCKYEFCNTCKELFGKDEPDVTQKP